MRLFVRIIIAIIGILASISVIGAVLLQYWVWQAMQDITDPSRYANIRHQQWSSQEQVKHFPSRIPNEAKDVRLVYFPGFMQGGAYFQVRMKLPPQKIQSLLSHYKTTAKHKFKGDSKSEYSNKYKEYIPTTPFYTSGSKNKSFPTTYELFVIDAHARGTSGYEWNHGNSYGVAIDSTVSEIVYWAEEW